MGIAIPQIVTSDRATGAQVIDGSLKFDSSNSTYLQRSQGAGNRRTFTVSAWIKRGRNAPDAGHDWFSASEGNTTGGTDYGFGIRFYKSDHSTHPDRLMVFEYENTAFKLRYISDRRFSDTGFYHLVVAVDTTQSTVANRVRVYVNGDEVTEWRSGYVTDPSQNLELTTNESGKNSQIGTSVSDGSTIVQRADGYASNFYLIDGQALGPEYFGFTDPLTNTWKPKKFKPIATPNDGTVWSTAGTITNEYDANNGIDKAFDGSLDNTAQHYWFPADGTVSRYTFPSVVRGTKFELYMAVSLATTNFSVNGQSSSNVSGAFTDRWVDVTDAVTASGLGGLSYIDISFSSSNYSQYIFAIRVDGVTLIDGDKSNIGKNGFILPFDGNSPIGQDKSGNGNDFTPVNFGGSNSVDKATGALPILNTTNGGNTATVGVRTDAFANNLVLALPLVGSENDVSNQINSGSTQKVMVAYSNAAASTAESNFYGGSFRFPGGTGDNVATAASSDFNFGSGDYTVEWWMYWTTKTGYQAVFDVGYTASDSFLIQSNTSTSRFIVYAEGGNILEELPAVGDAPLNKWIHYAVVRNGDSMTLYRDGVVSDTGSATAGSVTGTSHGSSTYIAYFGSDSQGYEFNGYLQDFRVYKGVAKYTSEFIPASTSPDILPDTPSGVSGGSKLTKITDGAVSFDGSGDYLNVGSSSDYTFGTGDYTVEMFVYHTSISGQQTYFTDPYGNSAGIYFYKDSNNKLGLYYSGQIATGDTNISTNKWTHIAISRTGGTSKLFQDGILVGSGSDSTNLTATQYYIGDNAGTSSGEMFGFISNVRVIKGTALYTANFTPPAALLTDVTNTKLLCCQSNTSATEAAVAPGGTGYTGTGAITLSSASLNAGAVANIVDGDTSTSADIRGAGSFVQMVFPQQQNGTLQVNVANGNDVGDDNIRVFIDGVEGTAFDVSSQSWHTIHTGDFTTVKLEHQGSTTGYIYGFRIGTGGDTIINGGITANGDAAATTFNPFNTDIHTVRGQETSYPTWNPLYNSSSTLSNGNLTITTSGGSGYPLDLVSAFTPAGRGQWYWEFTLSALSGSNYTLVGMLPSDSPYQQGASRHFAESDVRGFYVYVGYNGAVLAYSGAATAGSATGTIGVGDVLGWAYDAENGTLKCFINGVPQGTQFTNIRTDVGWLFGVTDYDNSAAGTYDINFGQKPFKFTPPDGFQSLNTANTRPVKVISRPDQFVGVTTYTGDNTASKKIDNLSFSPDLVWVKDRNLSFTHFLNDTVRGAGKILQSNVTTSETDNSDTIAAFPSFDPNGFTVGTNSNWQMNGNNEPYVGWCWKAGGSKNTFNVDDVGYASAAAAGLNGGTITPTGASVGTKQGFSIIKYTGNSTANATLPHGLSEAPKFVIIKNISNNYGWAVLHTDVGTTGTTLDGSPEYYMMQLDVAGTRQNFSEDTIWNPTSTTVKIDQSGGANWVNNSNSDYIMYAWHSVPGFSKFDKWTNNNSNDGAFIELGFKPAVILLTDYDGGENWYLVDSERHKFNIAAPSNNGANAIRTLQPNSANNEATADNAHPNTTIDFLSNGFKIRTTNAASGEISFGTRNYIYAAWAAAPSIDLYGGGANAR